MPGSTRFVYGFEYEEQADGFVGAAVADGHDAVRDARDDTIEAASALGEPADEEALDRLAMTFGGHALGARPA